MQPKTPLSTERFLVFGGAGVGKSSAALSIASHLNADATCWYVDMDNTLPDLMEGRWGETVGVREMDGETFEEGRIVGYTADDWKELLAAVKDIRKRAKRGDLIVLDSMSIAWNHVQDWYVEETFGKDIAGYFMQVRATLAADDKALGAFEGWTDWQVINTQWRKGLVDEIIRKPPCHLYLTAEAQEMSMKDGSKGGEKDKGNRDTFGDLKQKPVGQKRLPFQVRTVLMFSRERGRFLMTTAKDREREQLEWEERTEDFGADYLVRVAGWQEVGQPVMATKVSPVEKGIVAK